VRETLGVAINRSGLHTIDVEERFEAEGPFVVELRNHGEATHLHLHLDDDLSTVGRLEAANHYVENDETRAVRVQVKNQREWPEDVIRGKLKVVAGHGREKRFVDVVLDRTTEEQPVEVDPELVASGGTETTSTSSGAGGGASTLRLIPVAVLGLVAVLLAVAALFAADGINFVMGGFAVLAAALCAMAAYYLS